MRTFFQAIALLSIVLSSCAIEWERHAFGLPESIWSVDAADFDGDGRLDFIAMGETTVFVLTAPDWKKNLLFDSKEPKMLYCVVLDMDGDGDLDLAVGRYRVPWIEYREAQKAGKKVEPPAGPEFSIAWLENTGKLGMPTPLHILDRELNGTHGLFAADVNGDGIKDLIADSILGPAFPNSLVWFEVPSGRRHLVSQNGADGRPHYLDFADINKDGRGDILLGDSQTGVFTWWEQRTNDEWQKHIIARHPGATNLRPGDMNGDGKLDVIGSCGHGKGVFWFEAPTWTEHVIDPAIDSPHALAVADFDGDGDLDVAVASFTEVIVRWYKNDGHGNFKGHDIDTGNHQQAYDLKTKDLDGDGRTDLILAGRESRNAVWYRNRR